MKIISRTIILFFLISYGYSLQAQDTLPRFTVVNRNSKIILSWVNDFPVIKQLSIQRSSDSLKGFRTILTLPDPTSVTNGFLDNNAPSDSCYYKLYILLDEGAYVFSKAQKPHKYTSPAPENKNAGTAQKKAEGNNGNADAKPKAVQSEAVAVAEDPVKKTYPLQTTTSAPGKKRSQELKTEELNMTRPQTYTPSGFIFTNPEGNITVVLPSERLNHFRIKFYEENGNDLFQINTIRDHIFIVDKSSFMRAGWFRFELFEDGVLKEKNKVRVP